MYISPLLFSSVLLFPLSEFFTVSCVVFIPILLLSFCPITFTRKISVRTHHHPHSHLNIWYKVEFSSSELKCLPLNCMESSLRTMASFYKSLQDSN
jgi:hypothetical protein